MKKRRSLERILSLLLVSVLLFGSLGMTSSYAYGQGNTYTYGDLNKYGYREMIDIVSDLDYTQITDLFQYSPEAYTFYGDSARMDAIINALRTKGQEFTKNDDKGIPTLVEVLRAGYFLGFYNENLSYLNTRENKDKCIPAVLSIQNNSNFSLGSKTQDEVVNAAAMIVNNASSNPEVVNNFIPILKDFNENLDSYSKVLSKGTAVFNIIRGVEYDLTNYTVYENRNKPEDSPWYGKIDDFIEETGKLALIEKVNQDTAWIINNGIYCIGSLGKYHSNPKTGLKILTDAMELYPEDTEQHIRAADEISRNYDGRDYNGNPVDAEELKKKAEQIYYPKKYVFDDGNFIIKAGDKVKEEKIKRLYWAAKEVEAQYFRSIGTDKPLEEGNTDDVLTIIIYNNPDEYSMNSVINGLDTDNGGMYIERDGTFYTYERTEQESIYTLEELFRHEFTHYLQGRYVVPGMWGESEIYRNDRLVWYEEGGAEYFAGSTRTEGVKPRRSIMSGIHYANPSSRFTVKDILNSGYSSGFDFYNYACVFLNYMNHENMDMYHKLTNYIMKNDIQAFDNYVNSIKSDYRVNQEYENYMNKLLADFDNLDIPLVSDEYTKKHEDKDHAEIFKEIEETTGLKNIEVEKNESQYFDTFTLKGSYTGDSWYQGEIRDGQKMSKIVDQMLLDLSELEWSGYDTLTGYFINYRLDDNYNFVYDVVFHGYLPGGDVESPEEPEEPENPEEPEEPKPEPEIRDIEILGEVEGEEGDIYDYSFNLENTDARDITWKLNGQDYSSYGGISVRFDYEGIYEISLEVEGEDGNIYKGVKEVKIDKRTSNMEQEPNDDFESANKIELESFIEGSTSNTDRDYFYFEVTEPGYLEVKLEELKGSGSNFLVYLDYNSNQYMYYPTQVNGGIKKTKQYYYPGKYVVQVYGSNTEPVEYKLSIK